MKRNRSSKQHHGFSLVEVALALGIAAFCLVALLGLLPAGLSSSQNAAAKTEAVSVLKAVIADLKDMPEGENARSPYYGFAANDPEGTTIYVDADGSVNESLLALTHPRYAVTVRKVVPAAANPSVALQNVRVAWPAKSKNPLGWLESVIAVVQEQ